MSCALRAGHAAEDHKGSLVGGGHETEIEQVRRAAHEAFERQGAERVRRVQLHFALTRAHQVLDDVAAHQSYTELHT